jgi:hypothetical protein
MLTELRGKGGCVCQPAREGKLHCPLIVRPTSEDVITGDLFQALRVLNPHWWLADLLNQALGADRFRRQIYRKLKIELWGNRPYFPRELLPWPEGSTQVDVTITWENPPTTVFFEMKYLSDLSPKTSGDNGEHGYPSDQLIRNIRVGLWECNWFHFDWLFEMKTRDFVVIVVGPEKDQPLVARYRSPEKVRAAIPRNERLLGLPRPPFVGELSYADIIGQLQRQRKLFTRPERQVIDDVRTYLEYKRGTAKSHRDFSEPGSDPRVPG